MSTELQVSQPGELQPAATQDLNIMQTIARAAADPRVDVAKMQALLEMQERIGMREAEMAFNAAMARVAICMPRVAKNGAVTNKAGGVQSRYALFEDIDKIARPILSKEGLSFSFSSENLPGSIKITATLRHVGGHAERASIALPIDSSGAKNGTQGVGSTVTYGKRYLVVMMLNIITEGEDSDGRNAEPITREQLVEIEDMLIESGRDRDKFLAMMGVSKLAEISQEVYPVARNMLNSAIAQRGRQNG